MKKATKLVFLTAVDGMTAFAGVFQTAKERNVDLTGAGENVLLDAQQERHVETIPENAWSVNQYVTVKNVVQTDVGETVLLAVKLARFAASIQGCA